MGMQFASGPHKTAVLLWDPLTGQRSVTAEPVPACIQVSNELLGDVSEVSVVSAYKYLGGVVTSDHLPRLEVMHRRALAQGIVKPLARCFFSCGKFPLAVRRTFLRALCVSKFVYGSATLVLSCGQQRRLWYQAFISLWRNLLRPAKDARHKPHSFRVLHEAGSPSPPHLMHWHTCALPSWRGCVCTGPVLWALLCSVIGNFTVVGTTSYRPGLVRAVCQVRPC